VSLSIDLFFNDSAALDVEPGGISFFIIRIKIYFNTSILSFGKLNVSSRKFMMPNTENIIKSPTTPKRMDLLPSSLAVSLSAEEMNFTMPQKNTSTAITNPKIIMGFRMNTFIFASS
jgi:hypothetical protein